MNTNSTPERREGGKEISDENRIIAEFMGWKYSKSGRTVRMAANSSPYRLKDIRYRDSWDWLMPVIEKISRMPLQGPQVDVSDVFYPRTFGMPSEEGKPMFRFHCMGLFTGYTLIQAAYEAVVDFIKWHNDKTQQP